MRSALGPPSWKLRQNGGCAPAPTWEGILRRGHLGTPRTPCTSWASLMPKGAKNRYGVPTPPKAEWAFFILGLRRLCPLQTGRCARTLSSGRKRRRFLRTISAPPMSLNASTGVVVHRCIMLTAHAKTTRLIFGMGLLPLLLHQRAWCARILLPNGNLRRGFLRMAGTPRMSWAELMPTGRWKRCRGPTAQLKALRVASVLGPIWLFLLQRRRGADLLLSRQAGHLQRARVWSRLSRELNGGLLRPT